MNNLFKNPNLLNNSYLEYKILCFGSSTMLFLDISVLRDLLAE